eukprot:scaffold63096_cov53-Phaeocystis_antarctica.AAC.4
MRCGKRCGPGGVRALGGGDATGVHGEGPTQGCGGQGTRGAHPEHAVHSRDLGRVEAERLVERLRELPSRKAGMQCGKRCGLGGVRALGGGDAIGMCTGRARLKAGGGQGTRGAHVEHVFHVRDPGGVPAGNVRVEILQVLEEVAHVGDGRDVPVGNGAVRRNGSSLVSVERLDRRLQGSLGRERPAASWSPARAVISGADG